MPIAWRESALTCFVVTDTHRDISVRHFLMAADSVLRQGRGTHLANGRAPSVHTRHLQKAYGSCLKTTNKKLPKAIAIPSERLTKQSLAKGS